MKARPNAVDCPACGSLYHKKTLLLKEDMYECGCGYAVLLNKKKKR